MVLRYAGLEPRIVSIKSSDHQAITSGYNNLLDHLSEAKELRLDSLSLSTAVERFDGATDKGIVLAPLRDSDGGFALLIGRVVSNGELCCQVLDSQGRVTVIPLSELASAVGSDSIWIDGPVRRTHIDVGSGRVEVDRLWHNFGSVLPDSKVATQFLLRNTGNVPIWLSEPKTSCGCTSVDNVEAKVIAPGERVQLPIHVTTGYAAEFREQVWAKLTNNQSGHVVDIVFSVYGCRRDCAKVIPHAVDFGPVGLNSPPVERLVSVSEVDADQLRIVGVDADQFNITHEISRVQKAGGLIDWKIRLSFTRLIEEPPGEYRGHVTILTTSKLRPRISIGVRYRVANTTTVNRIQLIEGL